MTTGEHRVIVDNNDELLRLNKLSDRLLMEQVRSPIIVLEGQTVVYANTALCDLLRRPAGELVGTSFLDSLHNPGRGHLMAWMDLPAQKATSRSLKVDLEIVTIDNELRWLNGRFVRGQWEDRPAFIGFMVDLEERKQSHAMREQLQRAQKMESIGRLAGGMAHDMNNILGAIMGFASVLKTDMNPRSQEYSDAENILKACKKGRDLMLNLLGFARRGKYRMENFPLNEQVQQAVELLKHTINKKIRIDATLGSRPTEIHGDSSQIHHALMNVCINAVDAMGDEGVLTISTDIIRIGELDTVYEPDMVPGRYARLRVSDTGPGMKKEVLDQAFEPFFTTKPVGQGSGLGLPMVYGTVKNHGGTVLLSSAVDEGTTVTILLPLSNFDSGAISTLVDRRTPVGPRQPTVLLVDDEDMIRLAGKRILERLGYKVLLAQDGRAGLRTYLENRTTISLVLLDLMMPVMDGEETLMRLKEIDPQLPVLLVSGFSKEEKAEELIERGADGFIQKPFDLPTLQERIGQVLDFSGGFSDNQ